MSLYISLLTPDLTKIVSLLLDARNAKHARLPPHGFTTTPKLYNVRLLQIQLRRLNAHAGDKFHAMSKQAVIESTYEKHDVIIVGGGPVGLFLGLNLVRKGIEVLILEAEGDIVQSPRALG